MAQMHPEFNRLVIENAKLKATLKASEYEKQKMLELIQNLLERIDNCNVFGGGDPSIIVNKNPSNTDDTKKVPPAHNIGSNLLKR